MKQWKLRYHYSFPSESAPNPISSLSMSYSGDMCCAGTSSGQVYLFERLVDGGWMKTYQWVANREIVDVRMRKAISPIVLDTDFFLIQRKCPFLMTGGLREIRIWIVSDRCKPVTPDDYHPTDLTFPPIPKLERYATANEISLTQSKGGTLIGTIRACYDGLTFGYSEGVSTVLRRIDHPEARLVVYNNDTNITRFDFHPKQYDLMIAGDDKGVINFIDSRIQPTQGSAAMRFKSKEYLGQNYIPIEDCRFSPDGNHFFSRHFQDAMIWDIRNSADPIIQFNVPDDSIEREKYSLDGKDFFRSCWIDNNSFATGWYGSELYHFSIDGKKSKVFVTKDMEKPPKKLLFSDRKIQWLKKQQVSSIDVSPCGKHAAVSNGSDVFIYDLV